MDELVDLVMVSYNTAPLLNQTIPSIMGLTDFEDFKLWVIDNASVDNSQQVITKYTARWPDKMEGWISTYNRGYGQACNAMARLGDAPNIIFMNSDVMVHPECQDWISPLLKCLNQKDVGVAGPKMVNPEGKLTGACVRGTNADQHMEHYFMEADNGQFDEPEDCVTLSGAVYGVKREWFMKLAGFDPNYFFFYEETDFSFKTRYEGKSVRYCPESKIVHLWKQSEQNDEVLQNYAAKSQHYFQQKWQTFLQDGTHYGPDTDGISTPTTRQNPNSGSAVQK